MGVSDVLYLKYQCEFYIIIFEIFKIVKQNKTSRYCQRHFRKCLLARAFILKRIQEALIRFPPE